jgi:competence CoiA-like predicted nuclease
MVPPGGQHSPESLWHAESKQAIREWAETRGLTARVEARTADGRRRSDVEVVMPAGHRLAIELQRVEISDAEWIARHEDYAPGRDH